MTDYTFKIFRKFKIRPTTGLELCCGTGSALERFVDKGYIMAGLDQSAPMLAMAAKKLKGRGVTFYQKSLPKFRLLDNSNSLKRRRFDFVTCFYDSLNYVKTQRDLKTTFKSVHDHLNPEGWFIFDMNTAEALKLLWGGQVYADVQDDLAWIWKNNYEEKTRSAVCNTTFFHLNDGRWERFDEVHVERAYDNETIVKLLRSSGLTVRGFYRCFSFDKPTKRAYRVCGVAQRNK